MSATHSSAEGDRCGSAEALVALAQLVVSEVDADRLLREAARSTARALRADRCEVLCLEPGGELMLRAASSGEDAARDDKDPVPAGVSSAAGYALLCGSPIVSGDLRRERRFGAAGAPPWEGAVSAVAAPVPGRDGSFGALAVYAARAGAFDGCNALCVARVASMLGGALQLLEEWEELRRRAGVARGEPHRSEGVALSGRQLEVLSLMAAGRSAKQIASDLHLSAHTVRFHQRNLYRALGVGSLAGAVGRAAELGLLRAPDAGSPNR